MLYAIVALLIIILDQWTKYWVAGNIVTNTGVKDLIPGLMSLVNVHNDGAAFSFLAGGNARIIFVAIAGVFALFVIIALATNLIRGQLGRWGAIFVMAGGIGNCIDRILYGYVQDMFKLDFVNFAIFNVADAFITVGCLLFILYIIFGGNRRARRRDEDEDDYDEDDEDEFEDEDEDDEDDEPRLSRKERAAQAKAEKAAAAERARAEKAAEKAEKAEKSNRGKARQPKYEQDYEQFKAARAARQQEAAPAETPAAPAPASAPKAAARPVDPADPFAEWERANARAAAQGVQPARPVVQQPVVQQPVVQQPVVQQPVVQQPAAPQPAPAPTPRPAAPAAPASEEFSLEDILNEFK